MSRSVAELTFRARQEIANLRLWLNPPGASFDRYVPLAQLPDPAAIADALRPTPFPAELERLAEGILAHRIPLFCGVYDAGPSVDWRRDPATGRTSELQYFRRIPYLDFSRVGDHKSVWELNRHQHLVVLAQASLFGGTPAYVEEAERQVCEWLDLNPFMRGINWSSALEVGFRALSWAWVYHLAGTRFSETGRRRLESGLYRHALYLEHNLSVYFSPNTHLLGEAVALHALGRLFPDFPGATRWMEVGAATVSRELAHQVRPDGSHFEQSAYYHVYALDMFAFHAALAGASGELRAKLRLMARYLRALMGTSRTLPLIGDDDGGRLFHPYGRRDRFCRATLATCEALLGQPFGSDPDDFHAQGVWWLGPGRMKARPAGEAAIQSELFSDAGMGVLVSGPVQAIVDVGAFGPGTAGHSHSDTLAVIVRRSTEDVLIDPGTYMYVSDPELRQWFRGSSAHNVVAVDGRDQADAAGPFRWEHPPLVRRGRWVSTVEHDLIEGTIRLQDGSSHRRTVLLLRSPVLDGSSCDWLFVRDVIDGPPGGHVVTQHWHPAGEAVQLSPHLVRLGVDAALIVPEQAVIEVVDSWRSLCFGQRTAVQALRIRTPHTLPLTLWTAIGLGPGAEHGRIGAASDGLRLSVGGSMVTVEPDAAVPCRISECR